MQINLSLFPTLEHERATRPIDGPIPAVDLGSIVARILIRGEPQAWQRPATVGAHLSNPVMEKLADTLNTSARPLWDTLNEWRAWFQSNVRTFTPKPTLDAEKTVRAFLVDAMETSGATGPDRGIAFGLRARFYTSIGLTRADLDNYLGILYEAGSGVLYVDDAQIIEGAQWKVIRSDDPRTEAIYYRAGVYR